MKQYKHKQTGKTAIQIPYKEYIGYEYKIDNNIIIPKELIENTNDWEEITEPEPQEEVIEGYAEREKEDGETYYYFFPNENPVSKNEFPARLILNPKPKKEYVRWVMKEFIDNLENGYPIYRVLSTESDYEKYCHKIKITVEE